MDPAISTVSNVLLDTASDIIYCHDSRVSCRLYMVGGELSFVKTHRPAV